MPRRGTLLICPPALASESRLLNVCFKCFHHAPFGAMLHNISLSKRVHCGITTFNTIFAVHLPANIQNRTRFIVSVNRQRIARQCKSQLYSGFTALRSFSFRLFLRCFRQTGNDAGQDRQDA